MKKIENTRKSALEKVEEKKQPYTITVREKSNGFEARVTIKVVGGGVNPRLEAYSSSSSDESVLKLLYKVKARLIEYRKLKILSKDVSNKIYKALLTSISVLEIEDEEILKELSDIFQILTNEYIIENNNIDTSINPVEVKVDNTAVVDVPVLKEMKAFKKVALEWFNTQVERLEETEEHPNKLSPNTVKDYNRNMRNVLTPFFKTNENIALITEEQANECIKNIGGWDSKIKARRVLRRIFEYAKKEGYTNNTIELEVPKKAIEYAEIEIICLDTDRQPLWLDKFEEEDTDFALLCETLLMIGLRPEERMWAKVDSIK